MPKRKPDSTLGIRLELQESERAALEMVAMTKSLENGSRIIKNLIEPFTKCTVPGAIFAGAIFETILFTQNKGIIRALFGLGEDIGEATYSTASDLVSRVQKNYEQGRVNQAETMNPDHHTEIGERQQLRNYMEEQKQPGRIWAPSWSWLRGGWVDPVSGDVVSTDRNDPLYADRE